MNISLSTMHAAQAAEGRETPIPTRKAAHEAARAKARALVEDPWLSPAEGAAETGRAVSTFWRDVRSGVLPKAIYVTPKSPRWRRSVLRAAIEG